MIPSTKDPPSPMIKHDLQMLARDSARVRGYTCRDRVCPMRWVAVNLTAVDNDVCRQAQLSVGGSFELMACVHVQAMRSRANSSA